MPISPTRVGAVALAALPLSGCDVALTGSSGSPPMTTFVTATVTYLPGAPTSPADSGVQSYAWASGPDGEGVFSVGSRPADGLPSIPPGRYSVKLMPGASAGSWMLCNEPLCGVRYQRNAIATGYSAGPDWQSTLDIGADARSVWLYNVVLTPQ